MDFRDDVRAQPVVIGSLLIFTILILSFSAYQAFSVPNQNAQVEFEHFQDVEDQFSELRTSMVNAVGSDERRSTAIDLGTRYPSRILALNPPPAAGRLETTHAGEVTIQEAGTTRNVCSQSGTTPTTRSLEYTPGYNEFHDPQAVSYESRVISREFDGGNRTDQRMVRGDEISLYLLNGTTSENGFDTYSFEVNGSNKNTRELTHPNITIPSRFDATAWNNEILADRNDVTATPVGDRVKLNFNGTFDVSCAVIGLDSDPAFTPPSGGGGSSGGSGTPNINPSGDIRLNGVTDVNKGTGTVTVEFENLNNSSTDLDEARLNFYKHETGSTHPTNANLSQVGQSVSANLVIRGNFTSVDDPPVTFAGGDTTNISLQFDGKIKDSDWFVLTFQYDDGETFQYFVSLNDKAANSPVGGGGGGSGGSTSGLQVVSGSTPTGESTALEFDLQNAGSSDATITAFEVTTPGNQNSGVDAVTDFQAPPGTDEVRISTPRGSDGSAAAGIFEGFDFDTGTKYDMDKDATIKSGDTADFVLEEFNDGNVKLTYTKAASKSDSDLTVRLTGADGSTKALYFRVTNVNS